MKDFKQIAITGGSGHLGTCLIDRLLSQGYSVRAQYNSNLPSIIHPKLTWIQAEISDKKAIRELILHCDAVVHCASLISIGDYPRKHVLHININGTANVIGACINQPETRLIHISSSNAVLEGNSYATFDENRPLKGPNDFDYPYSKAEAERLVTEAVKHQNLDAVILRPTSIIGWPDYKPSLMGKAILDFNSGKLPMVTTGGYDLVDVESVAQSIIHSFEKGRKGQTYLLGGVFTTIKELAEAAKEGKRFYAIPIDIILFFLPLIWGYKKVFNSPIPVTKESLITLKNAPRKTNSQKAISELNHTTGDPNKTIKNFIIQYKKYQKNDGLHV